MNKLLPLPQQFDQNEWFVLLTLTLVYVLLILFRKKLRLSIAVLLLMFTITIARVIDHILAWPGNDLYDVMDTGKFELFDVLTYFLFAPFAVLYIYIYEKYQIRGLVLLIYIVSFALFSVLVESLALYFGVFTYKGWKLPYTLVFYMYMEVMLLFFYRFIRKHGGYLLKPPLRKS